MKILIVRSAPFDQYQKAYHLIQEKNPDADIYVLTHQRTISDVLSRTPVRCFSYNGKRIHHFSVGMDAFKKMLAIHFDKTFILYTNPLGHGYGLIRWFVFSLQPKEVIALNKNGEIIQLDFKKYVVYSLKLKMEFVICFFIWLLLLFRSKLRKLLDKGNKLVRIGIDISDLSNGITGVGVVILKMLEYFAESKTEHTFFLYQEDDRKYVSGENFIQRHVRLELYDFFREQVVFSGKTVLDRLDIFHQPIHLLPSYVSEKTKRVMTVHDLHVEEEASLYPLEMRKYFSNHRRKALHVADALIVHSQYVFQKLQEIYAVPEEKIHLFPLGVDEIYKESVSDSAKEKVRKKYQILEPFVLFVGSIEPWKNVVHLIEQFLSYKSETNSPYNLVLVGRSGWDEAYVAQVQELVAANKSVRWLHYVSETDLPALYQLASLFVSASLHEGFGCIFLEAFSAGLPVVAANCSAIPEIVGSGGLLFDLTKQDSLKDALVSLLEDEKFYEALKKRGQSQVQKFSWKSYGDSILKLYQSLNVESL